MINGRDYSAYIGSWKNLCHFSMSMSCQHVVSSSRFIRVDSKKAAGSNYGTEPMNVINHKGETNGRQILPQLKKGRSDTHVLAQSWSYSFIYLDMNKFHPLTDGNRKFKVPGPRKKLLSSRAQIVEISPSEFSECVILT
ncbi:hypothetical protein NPIL_155621 [Nephila pilipes]|uniref:Uncharacterized protein n=1 Tax=Nephila pilipes TaxID=299642 RepID=A0A8X6U6K0_NEPPI|nr:hypothetical protein NPIL_155621 [Nephila pilipes]